MEWVWCQDGAAQANNLIYWFMCGLEDSTNSINLFLTYQPIKQPIYVSNLNSQPTKQSVNQSITQPITYAINQSVTSAAFLNQPLTYQTQQSISLIGWSKPSEIKEWKTSFDRIYFIFLSAEMTTFVPLQPCAKETRPCFCFFNQAVK